MSFAHRILSRLLVAGLMLQLAACVNTLRSAGGSDDVDHPDTMNIRYRFIFLIHGDDSYLFHDTDGTPDQADERALAHAMAVAKLNGSAEVFIFHQRERRNILFMELENGQFYHYLGGKRLAAFRYRRGVDPAGFSAESRLLQKHAIVRNNGRVRTVAVYCGHQVPESPTRGYHKSYPKALFSVADLARGLDAMSFSPPASVRKPYDLVVLSTCSNGTPAVAASLAPLTHFLIASPEQLHLSYMDTPFLGCAPVLDSLNPKELAEELAGNAFQGLSARTSTVVAISVYNLDRFNPAGELPNCCESPGLHTSRAEWEEGELPRSCPAIGMKSTTALEKGVVRVFYRPPLFGRARNNRNHSGWAGIEGRP